MKVRVWVIAILAFLGMVDALYLSVHGSEPVPCTLTGGCDQVLTSAYASVGGISLSWFGLAFYVVVFSAAVFEFYGARALRWIFWVALAAFVFSLRLLWLQAFVIQAYCQYCLASAGFVTGILLASWPRRQPA